MECSGILYPRAIKESSKIQAHFYHHVNKDLSNSPKHICNPESYLHKLSKDILADSLLMEGSFILSYQENQKCINAAATSSCIKPITKEVDLSKKYPLVSVEKRDGEFIPDILLENEVGEKIYIEIYSTSSISDKKRASGHKIIQIKVNRESDIEKIVKARHINAKIKEVELIGFDAQVKNF